MTGMDEPTYTCAAWYIDDYGQVAYELAENEEEAAKFAAWADGDGTALGLQRADGSTVPAAEWPALAVAIHRRRQAQQELRDNPPTAVPSRQAADPFKGWRIDIETTEPDWLGG